MNQDEKIVLIRFKGDMNLEDITCVIKNDIKNDINDDIEIFYPLITILENVIEEGRQILLLYEFLPQSIVTRKSIIIKKSDTMFIETVKEEFSNQFIIACDFFYGTEYHKTKETSPPRHESNNVISILDSLKDKDNKVH